MSDFPEHGREPIPGLPALLPKGEHILWQGAPDWKQFAVRAMHVRKVAIYFGALFAWRLIEQPAFGSHLGFLAVSGLGLSLLTLLAWLMARSALYTITNRRVVMRFGIALPLSINLPFGVIERIDLRAYNGSAGDIAILPQMNRRLSYTVMWPHVRPWRFSPLQPMLRALPDAAAAAEILVDAISPTAAKVPAPVTAEPARDAAGGDERPRQRPFPLPPLLGAAALIGITIVSVAWFQWANDHVPEDPAQHALASVQLRFVDQDDGSVTVMNAMNDEIIDVLAPGTNNFLRATLRGLVRGRNAMGDLSERPFTLQQIDDGRLLLTDPVTLRHVDLWAFGETNAMAFKRLLDLGESTNPVSPHDLEDISASIDLNSNQEKLP